MDKYDYTITRRGQDEDGGTWADFTCTIGGEKVDGHFEVMPGADLEGRIRKAVKEQVDSHERWEAMTQEERDEIQRIADNFNARYSNELYYVPQERQEEWSKEFERSMQKLAASEAT